MTYCHKTFLKNLLSQTFFIWLTDTERVSCNLLSRNFFMLLIVTKPFHMTYCHETFFIWLTVTELFNVTYCHETSSYDFLSWNFFMTYYHEKFVIWPTFTKRFSYDLLSWNVFDITYCHGTFSCDLLSRNVFRMTYCHGTFFIWLTVTERFSYDLLSRNFFRRLTVTIHFWFPIIFDSNEQDTEGVTIWHARCRGDRGIHVICRWNRYRYHIEHVISVGKAAVSRSSLIPLCVVFVWSPPVTISINHAGLWDLWRILCYGVKYQQFQFQTCANNLYLHLSSLTNCGPGQRSR
jgi:hypothetical protein